MFINNVGIMKKCILVFILSVFAIIASAHGTDRVKKIKYPGGRAYMYRVTLTDKNGTPYSLDHPEKFLSEKSIARRTRQHLSVDSTDLPINPAYISAVNSEDVKVVSHSKWNNTLLVRCKIPELVNRLSALPFVKSVTKVWTSPDSINPLSSRMKYHTEFNRWDTVPQSYYGVTREQVEMIGGVRMHNHGFTGKGITIAVLDGGFMNADLIPCMQSINIAGCADFVVPKSKSVYKEMEHGTKVLSVMAVKEPYVFVGTAPDASYWLLRCEDELTESPAEEDYWAAAAEFADSVGVDIISSSLGFHDFDESSFNYKYSELDGHTALISVTASMLASKGIVLVNSAGNDGMSSWKKINVPADADDIITVGAVSPNRRNASFSSIGPTADGRVKPDVMAMGSPAAVITGRGTIIQDMGTSFSAPIISGMVACLWQALHYKTAREIIDIVRRCSDNYATPDNIFGYGVPDFWRGYAATRLKDISEK